MELTLKQQTWGDDLRLPCLVNAAETAGLLAGLERYRKLNQPFQSRHIPALKRGVWFALKRPVDRSRTGLLVVWPEKRCCIYVSGEPTNGRPVRIALLRLRVDPEFLVGAGLTVFAATLSSAARRLWIEDTLVWKGRNVYSEEIFSKRVLMAAQWLEHYCIVDSRLVGGVEMEMAQWKSLDELEPDGVWELQADCVGPRLLWITNHAPAILPASPQFRSSGSPATSLASIQTVAPLLPIPLFPQITSLPSVAPLPPISLVVTEQSSTIPTVAIATREMGPDQWILSSADGVSLGRALIRTMDVSAAMRSVKGVVARVEVSWNAGFKKWEIMRISNATASHSSAFVTNV